MAIKEASPGDYSTIASIYNEYISRGNATMEERIHTANDIAAWVDSFNNRERLYVVKEEDEVIGWGIIKRYSDRNGYSVTAETAVYLTASKIGNGYGSKMKRFLIDQCRQLKYHHLVAKIFAKNTTSIQYNLKLGYTIVGTQKEIGFKNNEWLDVTILQLLL